jgi:HlyD family type I secretion membrane fusion protein
MDARVNPIGDAPRLSRKMSEEEPLRIRGVTRAGFAVLFLFFGAFGGWAALAPLKSAAVAQGVIKVAGEPKRLQHLEGGIVAELNVADGDIIEAGDVLIRLDDTQARAQLDLLRNRILSREAFTARLKAERDGAEEIAFGLDLLADDAPPAAVDAIASQKDIFRARRRALESETKILNQRLRQTENEIQGLEDLIAIKDRQIVAIEEEASTLEALAKKGLTTRERQLTLRRQQREIEGERATNVAAVARARSSIAEIEQQILNLRTMRLNEAVDELSKIEAELFDLEQQRRAAEDVLDRTRIVAPVDGVVMGLQVHTSGGVVRPGETLITVVPLDQQLVVEATVRPEDVETIAVGQIADIRFSALSRYNLSPLEGVVAVVSADRLIEERTGDPYFTATIVIGDRELKKLEGRRLMPGMTSEVMIRTGSRTMLAYIAEPLTQSFRRALREK